MMPKTTQDFLPSVVETARTIFPRARKDTLINLWEKGWGIEEFEMARDIISSRGLQGSSLSHIAKIYEIVKSQEALSLIFELSDCWPQFSRTSIARYWSFMSSGENHLAEYEAHLTHEFLSELAEGIEENFRPRSKNFYSYVLYSVIRFAEKEGIAAEDLHSIFRGNSGSLFWKIGLMEEEDNE